MAGRQREADWVGFDAVSSIREGRNPRLSKSCSIAHFVRLLDKPGMRKCLFPRQQIKTKIVFCPAENSVVNVLLTAGFS